MRLRLFETACSTDDFATMRKTAPFHSEDTADTFSLLGRAFDMLAYPLYDPETQRQIRNRCAEEAHLLIVIERDPEGERLGYSKRFHPDRIELPEVATPLLKLVADITGAQYDGKQTIFYYAPILDQVTPAEWEQFPFTLLRED
jgi:hypothetical protein